MFYLKILPLLLFILQFASIVHLYIINKTANSHVPVVFIELNIIVFLSVVILILIYTLVYKFTFRSFWLLPLSITIVLSLYLAFYYLRMLF